MIRILLLTAVLLQPALASAQEAEGREFKSEKWMVNYYLNPRPEQTPKVILEMSREGVFDLENAQPPVISFYSRIFAANPQSLRAWFEELQSLPSEHRRSLWMALWYADTPEAIGQLRVAAEKSAPSDKDRLAELLRSRPPALTEIEIKSPEVLDMLWGAFMATGDERYVIRIMSALPWVNEKRNVIKAMLGGAARWSLASNCVQHEKVLQISKGQIDKQPKEVSQVLAGIVKEAEAEKWRLRNFR